MKISIFLLLLLMGLSAGAQSEYFYFFNAAEYESVPLFRKATELRKRNNVRTMTETTIVYKKGKINAKKNRKKVSSFDENGRLIQSELYNNDGELLQKTSYVLNDSGLVLEKKIVNGKGKIVYQLNKTYNPEGMILDYTFISNGKIKTRYTSIYNTKWLTERSSYKKNGTAIKTKLVYVYQADGQLKTTRQYNAKGKLTHTWNHDCLPEGQLLAARKDTTTICQIKEELAGGRFVTYTKNVDEKGVLSTTTTWYRGERMIDSTMTKQEGRHPITFIYKSENDGLLCSYIRLNEVGDTIGRSKMVYSKDWNQLLQENYYRPRKKGSGLVLNNRIVGEENANGLLISNQYFVDGVLRHQSSFTYTFFE